MAVPFFSENTTPRIKDTSRRIEMKILGAIAGIDISGGAVDYATGGNFSGAGSPEGVVTASPGATYLDTTSGAFWMKRTGTSTNTGWLAIVT